MPSQREDKVNDILKVFDLSDDQFHIIKNQIDTECSKGLCLDPSHTPRLKMIPTYVTAFPNGKETGRFLAVDFGGSNFRVLMVNFAYGSFTEEAIRKCQIPPGIMSGPGIQLFDFIAEHVKSFLTENKACGHGIKIPLGFTFSFACDQRGLDSAILLEWCKGFTAPGVVGKDVVVLLKEAFGRKKVQADVIAVANDTVALLMAGVAMDASCKIGYGLGTGQNASYVERVDRVHTFEGKTDADYVVINTEISSFGDSGWLDEFRNEFDRDVDRRSTNPRSQMYEKCVSGMYLGEIIRLVLIKFTKEGVLFDGKLSTYLEHEGQLQSTFLSELESDMCSDDEQIKKVLERHIGVINPSSNDLLIVRQICVAIRTRAAGMAAAAITGVMGRIEQDEVTVAVDGSLLTAYPKFKTCVMQTIARLTDKKVKFIYPKDGSGTGVTVIAAAAHRYVTN